MATQQDENMTANSTDLLDFLNRHKGHLLIDVSGKGLGVADCLDSFGFQVNRVRPISGSLFQRAESLLDGFENEGNNKA